MTTQTIKPSGGDWTTLSGWEASLASVLTAPQQADIYNFGSGGLVEAGGVAFNGFTTTSTNKLILNVPAGQRHTGVAHSGAYVTGVTGSLAITTIRMQPNLDNFDVNWLEVESLQTNASAFNWNMSCGVGAQFNMKQCIIHALFDAAIGAIAANGNYTYWNTVFYSSAAGIRTMDLRGAGPSQFYCCTIWGNACDFPFLIDGVDVIDTIVGGATNQCYWSTSIFTGGHNASTDATATAAFPSTGSINSISGSATFTSVTPTTENFLLQSGAAVINAGTTIGSFSTDFIGTTRPQSTAWDMGANEFIFGAGPTNRLPLNAATP